MNKGKNAILNSKDAVISGEEGYTFNSSELIFAVGLLDNLGQPIPNDNNRVFTISYYYCNKSLNETACIYSTHVQDFLRRRNKIKKFQSFQSNIFSFKFLQETYTILFYNCFKKSEKILYIPGTICGNRIQQVSQQLNIPKGYEDITYCMDEEYIKQNPEIRIQGSTRQDNFTLLGALQQSLILVIYSLKMSEQHRLQWLCTK